MTATTMGGGSSAALERSTSGTWSRFCSFSELRRICLDAFRPLLKANAFGFDLAVERPRFDLSFFFFFSNCAASEVAAQGVPSVPASRTCR